MQSIAHSLVAADAVQFHVESQLKRTDNRATTPQEIDESKIEKAKAINALKSTLSIVERALHSVQNGGRGPVQRNNKAKSTTAPSQPELAHRIKASPANRVNKSVSSHGVNGINGLEAATSHPSTILFATADTDDKSTLIQNLTTTMSSDTKTGLGSVAPSLSEMASSVEPIIDNFDSVLSRPYLNQFSATLNTVPVVGIKDQSIMYIQTTLDPKPLGTTQDVWSLFSKLPEGATIDGTKKVHLFPYKGDFCLAIGKSVWKKTHRNINPSNPALSDPVLAQAVDNWPKMYLDEWEVVGDACLPADDLLDVIPYAVLAADRTNIEFQLCILDSDSSVRVLDGEVLVQNSQWKSMTYKKANKDSPANPPKWTRMAYWNNGIVALDGANNTWDLTPDFGAQTYTAGNSQVIDPVTEFTASDIGPVVVQADGYLYKRIVVPPKDDGTATTQWTRWIKQNGVTTLGVASPGVILDLNLLTRTLKSRYIETQTAIYPVMNKIKAFTLTHTSYLTQLQGAANDYANSTDEAKQALAIKQGNLFVKHANVWANIIGAVSTKAKVQVNLMSDQLLDVNRQLVIQLQLLKDKLTNLQATLKAQEDALSKLNAAFWGMVAATLLGVAAAIIGTITGQVWLLAIAGTLFVGGIIGMVVLSQKIGELAGQIEDTKSQIRTVTEGITELTTVTTSFKNLATFYSTLNQFWGRMVNDSVVLKTMDEATAAQLGAGVLEDTSSIDAALDVTNKMTDGCAIYLDTLNKQGITLPDSMSLMAVSPLLKAHTALMNSSAPADFDGTVALAAKQLYAHDLHGYEKSMTKAFILNMASVADNNRAVTASGQWFDVPALNATGALWIHATPSSGSLSTQIQALVASSLLGKEAVTYGSSISNDLGTAKTTVTGIFVNLVQLADTMMSWEKEFPQIPTQEQREQVTQLQKESIEACEQATNLAAQANNAFNNFNHEATALTQKLDAEISGKNNEKISAQSRANSDKNYIDVPWYVALGGFAAVLIYQKVKADEIDSRLRGELNALENSIDQLRHLQDSGVTIDGQAQTWMQMAQAVSGHLGSIYNILSGVEGQLLEDPLLYASLLNMEWSSLKKNAQDVMDILGAHSPASLVTFNRKLASVVNKAYSDTPLRANAAIRNGVLNGAPKASAPSNAKLIKAVSPGNGLGSTLQSSAIKVQQAFGKIELLLGLPYATDIIVKWNEGETVRTTLADVSSQLRREYTNLVSTEYNTVESLYALSILQAVRANKAASGTLKIGTFVTNTLKAINIAKDAATTTNMEFAKTADKFDDIMNQINDNIAALQKQIAGIDENIATAEKKQRDQIIWVIADSIALAFSTGAMLATFGLLGPVTAAVSLAAKIGATAALTASSVKLTLDSLSLDDITKVISSLKSLRQNIVDSTANLTAVQPLFRDVVDGVGALADALNGMSKVLEDVHNEASILSETGLSEKDAAEIGKAWSVVGEDCIAWLDIVNAQGISGA